jgi:phycoerythrin-associated linker protein
MTIASGAKEILLPPTATKKMQEWIDSKYLICSGNFFVFESLEYSQIEHFEECIASLGGTLISVEPIERIWNVNRRKKILYQAKASLQAFDRDLRQYWLKYGNSQSIFAQKDQI